MQKSETISKLIQATISVMKDVKGIDKSMTIGQGNNSYKGVSDKDVKKIIGDSMQKNGLAIFPTGVVQNTQITEWDETYNGNTKHKQSILANVTTSYLLTHESGEFIEIAGYGHGVDSQDKAAGKATTYALKYALLYTFMVPTGTIDDADNTHSEEIPVSPAQDQKTVPKQKPLIGEHPLKQAIERTRNGEEGLLDSIKENFTITPEQEQRFLNEIQKP